MSSELCRAWAALVLAIKFAKPGQKSITQIVFGNYYLITRLDTQLYRLLIDTMSDTSRIIYNPATLQNCSGNP
jgi:hypothetical protein